MRELKTLSSGLRVVLDPMPWVETAALSFRVAAGTRHETEAEHGIAHLLEHMAFKGTQRRSGRDIVEMIEDVGGTLNASTGYESTTYYAGVLRPDVPLAIDILCDILQHSVFDEDELTREKNVVLQEIGEYEDMPDAVVFDALRLLQYPNQSFGRPVLGTRQSVQAITRAMLCQYLQTHYTTNNMLFVAAGAIDPDAICAQLEQLFVPNSGPASAPVLPNPQYAGGAISIAKPLEQVHWAIGHAAPKRNSPQRYAAAIFSSIVGEGMSSRLFQQVREDLGLAYTIWSSYASARDSGLLEVYTSCAPEDIAQVQEIVPQILQQATSTLTMRELQRARAGLKASTLAMLESPSARAESAASQVFTHGELRDHKQFLAELEAVTLDDVHAVGAQILQTPRSACVLGAL